MSVNWRYWRLAIDSIQTPALGLSAIEYWKVSATAGGTSIFTGGTPSASSDYGSAPYEADKAFDDDAVYWLSAAAGVPSHVQYDRGSGNATTGRWLEMRPYPPNAGYAPKLLRLQGSSDGSTWTTLLSVDIAGYAATDRWYLTTGTLRIPFGHIVSGNSTHSDTTEVQRIFINDWTTGALVDKVIPDSAGDWESIVTGPDDVLVTHIGDSGYRPLADGPVTPATR
jgi:hypothetical protein